MLDYVLMCFRVAEDMNGKSNHRKGDNRKLDHETQVSFELFSLSVVELKDRYCE